MQTKPMTSDSCRHDFVVVIWEKVNIEGRDFIRAIRFQCTKCDKEKYRSNQ